MPITEQDKLSITMSKGFHVQIVLMKKLLRKFKDTKQDKNKLILQKPKIKIILVLKAS